LAVPKWVVCFKVRPAPDTPLAASTTTPVDSMAPLRTNGANASAAAVT
jgi:hypothetical protein